MNSAILHQLGAVPEFAETDEPKIQNENQEILTVKAVAVKNLDKARAAGTHYSNYADFPAVLGMDAVGTLADGSLVYASGITGTLAEKAIINKNLAVKIPQNIDIAKASALPNAVLGAGMALKYRAKIQEGDTVYINGATGVTGQMAVQIAKYFGAKTVIASGRNEKALENLKKIGVDFLVDLKKENSEIIADLQKIFAENKVDIIIDYLWGETVETLLSALPKGGIGKFPHPVKIVTVGEMSGAKISLTSGQLRSADLTILGSGFGSLSEENLAEFNKEIMPEMFKLLAENKLDIEVETYPLIQISEVWNKKLESGKRLVIEV